MLVQLRDFSEADQRDSTSPVPLIEIFSFPSDPDADAPLTSGACLVRLDRCPLCPDSEIPYRSEMTRCARKRHSLCPDYNESIGKTHEPERR